MGFVENKDKDDEIDSDVAIETTRRRKRTDTDMTIVMKISKPKKATIKKSTKVKRKRANPSEGHGPKIYSNTYVLVVKPTKIPGTSSKEERFSLQSSGSRF